jgi:hypothetical protein
MSSVRRVARPESPMRSVPLLSEHNLGHYPEFRQFFRDEFGLASAPFAAPPVLAAGQGLYELVFVGYSGQPFPAGVEINALVPGLEPLDEDAADAALGSILLWLVDNLGGDWTADGLQTVAKIYRVPVPAKASAAAAAAPSGPADGRSPLL